MSSTIKIPTGRGTFRSSKGHPAKPWAKFVTAVAKNADSGHGYDGAWTTQGVEVEVEPGDIVAVQDRDGDGVAIHVYVPEYIGGVDGTAVRKPWWYMIVSGESAKTWAASCAAEVRRWLAMSIDERMAAAAAGRRVEIASDLARWVAMPADARPEKNSGKDRDRAWWIAFREAQLTLCDTQATPTPAQNPLAEYGDDVIMAEVRRRGLA